MKEVDQITTLIKKKKFEEAKELYIQSINILGSSDIKIHLSIMNKVSLSERKILTFKLQEKLIQEKRFQDIYKLEDELKLGYKNVTYFYNFIHSLWETGQLYEFKKEREKLYRYCLEKKYYNLCIKFEQIDHLKSLNYIYLKLIYACEVNDENEIIRLIKIFTNNSNFQFERAEKKRVIAQEIFSILKKYEFQSARLELEKIYWEGISTSQQSNNNTLKLILGLDLGIKYPLLALNYVTENIRYKLAKEIKELDFFEYRLVKFDDNVKKYYLNDILVAKKLPNKYCEEETFQKIEKIERREESKPLILDYVTTKYESELLKEIENSNNFALERAQELIIPMFSMSFFKVVLELAPYLKNQLEGQYYTAMSHFKLRNFYKVIEVVNDSLDKTNDIDFLFLKACALEEIGEIKKAVTIFEQISIINPDHRNVKERVKARGRDE